MFHLSRLGEHRERDYAQPAGVSVMREQWRSSRVLSAGVLSAVSLAYAGHCLWLGLSLADPMPLSDQWAFVHDYFNYLAGHYSWTDLFSLHNEHRVVTTRIVLFADAILFGMRGLLPVAVAYASMAAMAVISAFVVSSRSTPERFTCFAAALGLVWSSAQWPSFLYTFNLQNIFVHLFALACLVAVWCASRSRFYLWIAVALAVDALCVLSAASGVFIIVPALLLALFLRTWRTLVLLALFHSALVVLYFTGYHLPAASLPYAFDPIRSPTIVAEFIGLALGKHEAICGALGLILFAVAAAHISYLAVVRRPAHPACYIMAALACFVVIEAAAAGYARSGYGVDGRYGTASVVFWAALFGLLWRLAEHRRTRLLVPVVTAGAIFAMNAPHFEVSWRLVATARSDITAEVRRGEFSSVRLLCQIDCEVPRLLRELQRLAIGPFLPGP
jgi:hypothetical protein